MIDRIHTHACIRMQVRNAAENLYDAGLPLVDLEAVALDYLATEVGTCRCPLVSLVKRERPLGTVSRKPARVELNSYVKFDRDYGYRPASPLVAVSA